LGAAQQRLAKMYEEGKEIPRDLVRAGALWRMLAEGAQPASAAAQNRNRIARQLSLPDRAAALLEYGRMLRDGKYRVGKLEAAGWEWIQKAAEQGSAEAQCEMGKRYALLEAKTLEELAAARGGETVHKLTTENVKEAARWFELAANSGSAEGRFRLSMLGFCVNRSNSLRPDIYAWDYINVQFPEDYENTQIRLAAEQGYVDAQAVFAGTLKIGSEEWRRYNLTAARRGSAIARWALAEWYSWRGGNDRLRALLWRNLAQEVDSGRGKNKEAVDIKNDLERDWVDAVLREIRIAGLEFLD
jgi:TPR repeat protein